MNTTPIDLVIARYQENLDWLSEIPDGVRVTVYDKGANERSGEEELPERIDRYVRRRNVGREADTFLYHIFKEREHADPEGFTVFCQGDPFEHSPDLLKLIEHRDEWAEIQPLTIRWKVKEDIPPAWLIKEGTGEHVAGIPIRTELFSLHTWMAYHYQDSNILHFAHSYRSGHGLPNGANIAEHFLRSVGWEELAAEAEEADFGQFAYGAIFAVRNERLQRIPEDVLKRMLIVSQSHMIYAWFFERLWLHLFGLPFHGTVVRHEMPTSRNEKTARKMISGEKGMASPDNEVFAKTIGRILRYIDKPADRMMVDQGRLMNLQSLLRVALLTGVEGEVVELGCHDGGSSLLIRMTLDAMQSSKKFHVYDSFEGLPELVEGDQGSVQEAKKGYLKVARAELENNFKVHQLELPVVHEGWFADTLPSKLPRQIAFAHLDGDVYSSIKESLEHVYPRMERGGIIVIDDYDPSESASFPGCAKASDEFFADKTEEVMPFSFKEYYPYSCQGIVVKV